MPQASLPAVAGNDAEQGGSGVAPGRGRRDERPAWLRYGRRPGGEMRRTAVPLAASLLVVGLARVATATEPGGRPGYDRPGWYVGVAVGTGIPFLDDAIEDTIGARVELRPGGSFNARIGYRVFRWLAIEGQYEGVYGSSIDIGPIEDAAARTNHSLVANLKLLLPIRRFHPYLVLGPGAQAGSFDARGPFDLLDVDAERWDFMLRGGAGVDLYLTRHWLLNAELAGSARFKDWNRIPSKTTDNVQLNASVGVQYRF